MKYCFSILLFCWVFAYAEAQVLLVSSDSITSVESYKSADVIKLKSTLTNPTDKDVTVAWKRSDNQFESTWKGTKICDIGTCHPFNQDSAVFQVPASSSVDIEVEFHNDYLSGSGFVEVYFMELSDTTKKTRSLKYSLEVEDAVVSSVSTPTIQQISMYPNPVYDVVNVKTSGGEMLDRVEIYNILGRKVLTHQFLPKSAEARIDMETLQKGIYMMRVFDHRNNVVATKSISKAK